MRTVALEEVVERLERLNHQLSRLGFNNADRFRQQIKLVNTLAQSERERAAGKVVKPMTPHERTSLEWSLLESLEFADALRTLEETGCVPPDEILKLALHGPLEPILETHKNSRGRNTMFELTVAGDIAAAGLQPKMGLEADVVFELDGKTIFVECKRVFSIKRWPHLIADASRQLSVHLKGPSRHLCGIMAFCVTPLFTKGDRTLRSDNESQAREAMSDATDKLFEEHSQCWSKIKDSRIAGLILHLALPGWLGAEGFATCAHTKLERIPNARHAFLLHELTRRMEACRR